MMVSRNTALMAAIPLAAFMLFVSGCKRADLKGAPPHATDLVVIPHESSLVTVPLDTDISALSRVIEQEIPRQLWTINRHIDGCVAPKRVKVFGTKIAVTPKLSCDVVGVATRGAITLHGEGQDIVADLPIHATVSARNVGGVISQTASGNAVAQARIRLEISGDWSPQATVKLHYTWTSPPGIDILGKRITFTDKADERLQPVILNLERKLPGELAKLNVHGKIEAAWRQAFTTLQLNGSNPPVWMRITPERLGYGGYVLEGRTLRLKLGLQAVTETFVGEKPKPAAPTALPSMTRATGDGRLRFSIPVIAQYSQLEPVVLKALKKRSTQPFDLPAIGPVMARFGSVDVYGAPGNRIAVGLSVSARSQRVGSSEVKGRVWLTAMPVNVVDSRKVSFRDLKVTGATDGRTGDLLLALANSPGVSQAIAEALDQNFTKDFDELLLKVRKAIVASQQGDFLINAQIDSVDTGVLKATGQGIYLPVWANGKARVSYRPHVG